jgi:hypothetical protein
MFWLAARRGLKAAESWWKGFQSDPSLYQLNLPDAAAARRSHARPCDARTGRRQSSEELELRDASKSLGIPVRELGTAERARSGQGR